LEANAAAKILGVDIRENLQMADGFFSNDEIHQRKIIQVLRKYQPEIVLCNAPPTGILTMAEVPNWFQMLAF
jgi:LmbE family N-acetylglucosaminyl deacetylase